MAPLSCLSAAPVVQTYLIIVIQSHTFQSHNFMSLSVFGLEHGSIGTWGEQVMVEGKNEAPSTPQEFVEVQEGKGFQVKARLGRAL